MATRLSASPKFPSGTVLGLYPKLRWGGEPPRAGDTPRAASVGTATVDPFGFAAIEGVEADETFYVGALVSGAWRWTTVTTNPPTSGGGGGTDDDSALEAALAAESAARTSADAGLAASIAGLAGPSGLTAEQVDERIQAFAPLTGIVWPLGVIAVNAAPELDLRKGRVFTGTASGAWKLKAPTHPPVSPTNEALFCEVRIATSEAPTREGIGLEGEAPVPSGSVWCAELVSRDNGATWAVIGPPAPPTDVPRVHGTPTTGQAAVFNGEGKLEGTAPGLAKAAVDAEIVANALSTGGVEMAASGAPGGAGLIPLTSGAHAFDWVNLVTSIREAAMGLLSFGATVTSTATTALGLNTFTKVTAGKAKLTMPSGTGLGSTPAGRIIAVENASTEGITVEAAFTVGSPGTLTTTTIAPGETVFFMSDAEAVVWIPVINSRTRATTEALVAAAAAGEWAVCTGLNAKLEAVAGANAYGARAETNANDGRLRGKMKVKAGETLKAAQKVCTVPAGRRPSYEVWDRAELFSIATNGEVTYLGPDLAAGSIVSLESLTYPLT